MRMLEVETGFGTTYVNPAHVMAIVPFDPVDWDTGAEVMYNKERALSTIHFVADTFGPHEGVLHTATKPSDLATSWEYSICQC